MCTLALNGATSIARVKCNQSSLLELCISSPVVALGALPLFETAKKKGIYLEHCQKVQKTSYTGENPLTTRQLLSASFIESFH